MPAPFLQFPTDPTPVGLLAGLGIMYRPVVMRAKGALAIGFLLTRVLALPWASPTSRPVA